MNSESDASPYEAGETPATDIAEGTQPARRKLPYILWGLACLAMLGVVAVRLTANDHAVANILTVLISMLAWLFVIVGLFANGQRLFSVLLGIAPPACFAAFLALNKFEGLDSELVPQFRSRFEEEAALPALESEVEIEEMEPLFAPTEQDFPQFLGPDRTGVLNVSLNSNWESARPEIVWKQPIGEGWAGFAVQGDAAITIEQRDESEWVSAYSVEDGSLLWKYVIESRHTTVPGGTGPRSTPTIFNGRVYACSAVDQFVCLNLVDGSLLWKQDLLALGDMNQAEFEKAVSWGRSGSPLIVDDKVVVPLGGNEKTSAPLIAFDTESGKEMWRAGSGQITYSSPILATIAGVRQILFVSAGKAASYEPETGQQLWEVAWPGVANANPSVSHPVQIGDRQLLLGKGYGQGAKLIELSVEGDTWASSELWKSNSIMKTKFATAVVLDGFAYGLSDGILECIDVATGKRQWKRGRYKHGQLLLLKDKLLILTETGDLAVVKASPDKHEELAKMNVISGVTWNTFALSGSRLLVRNSSEAACVLLDVE